MYSILISVVVVKSGAVMTSEEQQQRDGFEETLSKHCCDKTTRLIYADWLEERGEDDLANEQRRRATDVWIASYKWMEAIVPTLGETCINYDEVCSEKGGVPVVEEWQKYTTEECIVIGWRFVKFANYAIQQGSDEARQQMYKHGAEFWHHWSVLTGHPPPEEQEQKHGAPFSCTC